MPTKFSPVGKSYQAERLPWRRPDAKVFCSTTKGKGPDDASARKAALANRAKGVKITLPKVW